jgi:outer membrane receptor protein involved in Fe transport
VCATVSLLILLFFISSTNSNRPALALLFTRTLRNLLRVRTSSAALRNACAVVRSALEEVVATEVAATSSAKKVVEVEEKENKDK